MKLLVQSIRKTEEMLGLNESHMQKCEEPNEFAVRRSISTIRNMEKGEVVSKNDLCWLRPRDGYAPGEEHLVIGQKLIMPIKTGQSFTPSHFIRND